MGMGMRSEEEVLRGLEVKARRWAARHRLWQLADSVLRIFLFGEAFSPANGWLNQHCEASFGCV